MPELPEVETVKRKLIPLVVNQKIIISSIFYNKLLKNIDQFNFINLTQNQNINNVLRRAKYLIFELDNFFIISHLRMEGKWNITDKKIFDFENKHLLLCFELGNGKILSFLDFRKFATIDLIEKNNLETFFDSKKIGPEPWEANLEEIYKKINSKKRPIKTILLDQGIISGIGNIYADEILYDVKIHPQRVSNTISFKEVELIIQSAKQIFDKSIKHGGSSIKTYESLNNEKGDYQNYLQVHTKKGHSCFDENHFVKKIVVGGRGTYFCEGIQK